VESAPTSVTDEINGRAERSKIRGRGLIRLKKNTSCVEGGEDGHSNPGRSTDERKGGKINLP